MGERERDCGPITDVWFLNGKTRTLLASHLDDATAPELDKSQRKELRHAVSLYRKQHKKPVGRIELGFTKREITHFNPGELEVSEERPEALQQEEEAND